MSFLLALTFTVLPSNSTVRVITFFFRISSSSSFFNTRICSAIASLTSLGTSSSEGKQRGIDICRVRAEIDKGTEEEEEGGTREADKVEGEFALLEEIEERGNGIIAEADDIVPSSLAFEASVAVAVAPVSVEAEAVIFVVVLVVVVESAKLDTIT